MQQIRIAGSNRLRYKLQTCLGTINQSAKLGGNAYGFARYSVATVKSGGVVCGLHSDGRACIRIAPVKPAVIIDHERIHHRVGVADAIGQHDNPTCLTEVVEVSSNAIERVACVIETSRLEHDVGADEPCAHGSEQFAVERVAFKRAWSLAGKSTGELDPANREADRFQGRRGRHCQCADSRWLLAFRARGAADSDRRWSLQAGLVSGKLSVPCRGSRGSP